MSNSRFKPWADFEGVKLFAGTINSDQRGTFGRFDLKEIDIINFDIWSMGFSVNDNSGTFRGIHFQKKPYEQSKVVWVSNGKLLDLIVDLRRTSSTFMHWTTIELKAGGNAILVPKGFGHGFLSLEDFTIVNYLFDTPFKSDFTCRINVRDPELNIHLIDSIQHISDLDSGAPTASEFFGGLVC
jgi:dTDP-4-dehydrorhamnose 3,5-epimerase